MTGNRAESSPASGNGAVKIATVPMRLELNRPYIDVELTGPNGRSVRAHAWVDTGGGAILFSAGLAKRLGLKPTAKPEREEGHMMAPAAVPGLHIGSMAIKLANARAFIITDAQKTLSHTDAQMALPGRMLRNYTVVFDYPKQTFTVAVPGALHPKGTAVKAYIGESGMPVVWVSIAGKSHGFLMDTGGQFCMISDKALHGWMKRHPDWPRVTGAYGPANMLFGKHETGFDMLRIGEMNWGPFLVKNVGAVSRPVGTYEKWMSKMLDKPIIGSIAGNVLRDFRVTIVYPAGKVYLDRETTTRNAALDMVGLTLEPAAQGGYEVAGTAIGVWNVQVGDRLLKIDGENVVGIPFYRVVGLLSGKQGETHALNLIRSGKRLTVKVIVRPIL